MNKNQLKKATALTNEAKQKSSGHCHDSHEPQLAWIKFKKLL